MRVRRGCRGGVCSAGVERCDYITLGNTGSQWEPLCVDSVDGVFHRPDGVLIRMCSLPKKKQLLKRALKVTFLWRNTIQ